MDEQSVKTNFKVNAGTIPYDGNITLEDSIIAIFVASPALQTSIGYTYTITEGVIHKQGNER